MKAGTSLVLEKEAEEKEDSLGERGRPDGREEARQGRVWVR